MMAEVACAPSDKFRECAIKVTYTPEFTLVTFRLPTGGTAALRIDQTEAQDLGCRLLAAAINAKAGKRGCV